MATAATTSASCSTCNHNVHHTKAAASLTLQFVAYTPAARYYVKECSKDKLVLSREEVNVDGPNLIEGDVTFRRMGLYTK